MKDFFRTPQAQANFLQTDANISKTEESMCWLVVCVQVLLFDHHPCEKNQKSFTPAEIESISQFLEVAYGCNYVKGEMCVKNVI